MKWRNDLFDSYRKSGVANQRLFREMLEVVTVPEAGQNAPRRWRYLS